MINPAEKFEHFSRAVLNEAKKQYEVIIKQAENEVKEKTEDYENVCLEEAYKSIKKQQSQISKSVSEAVSKFARESKASIIKKRNSIVEEVFNSVLCKIKEFKDSDQYKEFLLRQIKTAVSDLGEGEIVIYLDKSDEVYIPEIKGLYKNSEVLLTEENIIGGCKVLNKTKMQISDNSIAASLNVQKQDFLMSSGLIL